MDSLLSTSSAAHLAPRFQNLLLSNGFSAKQTSQFRNSNVYSSPFGQKLLFGFRRRSVIVGLKKSSSKNKKEDTHRFAPKPDEATGVFPEAVLLKEKRVREDGNSLPEFADAEEEKLYEYLNLQLQSDLNVERMRHYEVVYLIHEKHAEEVENVNETVQDFLREKKGKIWRVNDWGMRRLAYKIQKAKNAHYILMNFELEANWINDFKNMLDKDERVIRHLVIKRDTAITEDSPPPPEFHTLRSDMDDGDEENDTDYDDEDIDDDDLDGEEEGELEELVDQIENGIIFVNSDDEDNVDDRGDRDRKSAAVSNKEVRKLRAEKVRR